MNARAFAALLLQFALALPAQADTILELGKLGLATRVPDSWQAQTPSSSFRLAQFVVPGASAADCVYFYFGPGQGGSVDANIERWRSQFRSADGGPVQAQVERIRAGDIPVTLIQLAGSYARSMGVGQSVAAIPDQMMRVAMAETPQGNLIIQLYGARATVTAQGAAFDAMVRALQASR